MTVITVRVPPEEHAALRQEAWAHKISMNQLCRIKLREPVDPDKVPSQAWAEGADDQGQQPPGEGDSQ
jgi:plasmid stability protein